MILLQNAGDYWSEVPLPITGGCRAAVWADYNQDGMPDLLLATTSGPKLFANQGQGVFRDASGPAAQARSAASSAAAWIDHDGDGWPDILLATAFHGLRLYRNQGTALPPADRPKPGQPLPQPVEQGFEDVSERVGLGPDGIAGSLPGRRAARLRRQWRRPADFLYAAERHPAPEHGQRLHPGHGLRASPIGPARSARSSATSTTTAIPTCSCRSSMAVASCFHNDGKGRFAT